MKLKEFFSNKIVRGVEWGLLSACCAGLIIGGVSANGINKGVALVAGVISSGTLVIKFISDKNICEDRHTAYMTFRIISAKSPSNKWIRKGVPPNDVVGALQRKVSHNIENMLKAALIADLTP